jgi:signal transduction histidine kinase
VELPDRGGERILVAGSDKLVRRAIRNLVSNAIRHAHQRVRVTLERRGAYVRVFVDDDGAGVAVADRVRILEPFTRVDASRSRGSGGVGLGLAIVERIVNAHRGRLAVREAPLGGARFAMSLPVADSQQDARRAWWDR